MRWGKSVRRWVRFQLLRALLTPLAWLPRSCGLRFFGAVGRSVLPRVARAREPILANTQRVFPDWPAAQRRDFVRRVGWHLGRNAFDFVRLSRTSLEEIERLVVVEGQEHLERARRAGLGVICLSAHLGCWELLPYRMRGLGYRVAVVYRHLRDPRLDRYVAERRRRFGIEAYERDRDGRAILRCLREGALLGVLADQDTRVDSIPVPFLGVPARTPTGPVRLALRTGAPLVPVVIAMGLDGRHRLQFGAEIPLDPALASASGEALAEGIQGATRRCNEAIGALILPAAEQWVWFHQRWGPRGEQRGDGG